MRMFCGFLLEKQNIQTKEVYFLSNLLLTIVFQHPFIANVTDNKPLKELYNEAKAVVIEELEDLPEDKEVLLLISFLSFSLYFSYISIEQLVHSKHAFVQLIGTGALACDVSEPRMATGSEHFARQDSRLSQSFKLIVSTNEKRLNNINVVV